MAIKEQKQTLNFMIHDLLRSMLQRKNFVVEDDKHTKSVMFLKKIAQRTLKCVCLAQGRLIARASGAVAQGPKYKNKKFNF